MEDNVCLEEAKLYLDLVKERFHGTTAETFDKFKQLVCQEPETVDMSTLFSEVTNLFSKHHDLIEKFKPFLYYIDHNRASSVESNVEQEEQDNDNEYLRSVLEKKSSADNDRYLRLEKKSTATVKYSCVDFINRVKRILKEKDKVDSVIKMISQYQRHGDVERVEREAFCLFKGHPELEIEFSEFVAEANAGRTVQEMVVSKKRKRKEARDRTDKGETRELSESEIKFFFNDNVLYDRNMSYNMMLLAKEGAQSLLRDNSERKHLREEIWVAGYFRGVNLEFMRNVVKMEKVLDKFKLLSEKTMERGEAIFQSEYFVGFFSEGIKRLTRAWSEETLRFISEDRERDLQIPVFDWQAAQLTE